MPFVDWGQMFDSLCDFCDFHVFLLFSTAYKVKNDHAGPTYVAGVD